MGCATSKAKHSKSSSPKKRPFLASAVAVSRSYSMLVHHPPSSAGDSYHVVALTSTTLGSLPFHTSSSSCPRPHYSAFNGRIPGECMISKAVDRREAKAWSKMIDEKMENRTPPPGEAEAEAETETETINAWEMMEGLEDTNSNDGQGQGEMDDSEDAQVIWALRKALGELSPTNPFRLSKVPEMKKKGNGALEMHVPIGDGTNLNVSIEKEEDFCGDANKERLILYLTSLRGIRKTYEDCCEVKLILKGMGARVDERDVSMHCAFKEEMRDRLVVAGAGDRALPLPRVFVGDRYLGGADEIRRMDEEGCLRKALRRCEEEPNSTALTTCNACGDIRFIPCETCSGSCKVYYYQDQEEEVEEEEEEEFGFQRCPDCNENGLIRCPICCL